MKKKWMRIMKTILTFVLCVNYLLALVPNVAKADERSVGPCVLLESYSLTDNGIIPGKSFKITLKLKNYGGEDADDLMLGLTNPRGVTPKYGTGVQVFLGNIPSGTTKEVSFDYDSYTSINTEYLDFGVNIVSKVYSNYFVLSVPVSTDLPFSVNYTSGPETVAVNEKATYSVGFKVLGRENVSNVAVVLSVNGQAISTQNIGILTPGTVKSQNITTVFENPGLYNVEQIITYMDSTGVTRMMLADTISVLVEQDENGNENETLKPTAMPTEAPSGTPLPVDNTTYILALSGAIVVIIILIVLILIKKKK